MNIPSKYVTSEFFKKTYIPVFSIISVFILYYSSFKTQVFTYYLGFHTVLEILSVALSFMIFIFQWSIRSKKMTSHMSILGSSFLAVGFFDLFHALSFKGMPDFFSPNSVDKSIDFWLCARIAQTMAFVLIAFTQNKNINKAKFNITTFSSLALVAIFSWSIFYHINALPSMFIEGHGLTPSKVYTEYTLLFLNICASIIFYKRHLSNVDMAGNQNIFLTNASLLMVASELCFSLFTIHNDMLNFWGHILKASCYVYIYRALLLREFLVPYEEIESIKKELALDVENIRSLELELERSRKIASLGTEVGRIAHDLNNILMIINTAAFSILKIENNNENPLIVKKIDQIKQAVEKSRVFLKSLVNFSKNVQVKKENVNLNSVFAEYQTLLGPLVSRHIKINYSCEANLSLSVIPSDLEQLLLNLVVNARDAMVANEGVININAESKTLKESIDFLHYKIPVGDYLCLSVEDNGAGIRPENLSKIFNPFFTTKEVGKGTGIGLATVVSLMQKNNGYIQVQTELGVGSKFTLFFSKSQDVLNKEEDSLAEIA